MSRYHAHPVPGSLKKDDRIPSVVSCPSGVNLDTLVDTLKVLPASVPASVSYRADLSGRISGEGNPQASRDDVMQRMAYVRARHAEYDRYNALPRRLPDRTWNEAEFARHLDDVMGDNEVKRAANLKVKLKEAMEEQVAERRHAQWTRQVYLPIANSVAAGVDASFSEIHRQRREAYEGYLKATDPENVSRGMVFLDGNSAAGGAGYNPWALNQHATVRCRVKVRDPLKVVLTKRAEESSMMAAAGTMRSATPPERAGMHHWLDKSPQRLAPAGWVMGNLETQPFGHFEVKELRSGGVADMAFAGKDTESTWRGYDFDHPSSFTQTGPLGRSGSGRLKEVDAEFPIGKRFEVNPKQAPGVLYPQRSSLQESMRMQSHRVHEKVYDFSGGSDGVFTDGPLLDTVKPAAMASDALLRSVPFAGYGNPHSKAAGRNRYADQPYPKPIGEQLGTTYRRPAAVVPMEPTEPVFVSPKGHYRKTLSTQEGYLNFNIGPRPNNASRFLG